MVSIIEKGELRKFKEQLLFVMNLTKAFSVQFLLWNL